MRLTRLSGADLRKDPAQLADAIKAQGFFPGQQVVLIDDAGDGTAPALEAALSLWAEGDAFIIATAGQLGPRSALRKLFEGHKSALAAPIYTDPPSRDDVETALRKAGVRDLSPPAMQDLLILAQALDPGDFRQTIEKLALYTMSGEGPVTPADILAIAPQSTEADLDDVISAVAEGALDKINTALPRIAGQGTTPTTICIALNRHFRTLHAAASHPQGPEQGLARARPPVFGPRRDRMARQARAWGPRNLEFVLRQILEEDLTQRSAKPVPARASIERLMLRIASARKKIDER